MEPKKKALSKEEPDHRGEQRPFSLRARKKQKLFLQTNPEGSPRIHLIYNSDFSRHFCPSPRRVIGPIEIQVASLFPQPSCPHRTGPKSKETRSGSKIEPLL
ncbi:hypothetical protein CDAR_622811 [Caerostris darwini]|uniref:Uncharacterized protein n=1 Tax=Caerostris darwini TaxID=1538125 RepID=A0AAV4WID7_9ARAC|nr:hypothetical protein CDAR_622811 [Caerostris darwini]